MLTGVLIATMRDPQVKAHRQTLMRAPVPSFNRRQRATQTRFSSARGVRAGTL